MPTTRKYYEHRKDDDRHYWHRLREEFNWMKQYLKASEVEIADGLAISRQLVNDFMHSSKKERHRDDLPIQRANLLALYDYLTDNDRINESLRLSKEIKEKRQEWRLAGPDQLLLAAGYQPTSKKSTYSDFSSSRRRKIHRITSRLNSSFLKDVDVWDIETVILDRIVERLRSSNSPDFSSIHDPEKWLIRELAQEPISKSNDKFISAIRRFKRLGKSKFEEVELFELYQTIRENELLRSGDDRKFKVRVLSCEFRNISSLFQAIQGMQEYEELFKRMCFLGAVFESRVRGSIFNRETDSNVGFQPVKEARLRCSLNKEKQVSWFYRSNSTHVENMLLALRTGLGYSLKLKDLSMRAVGSGSRGLARVSVIMEERLGDDGVKFYQGMWVDLDTLLAISQSIVVAVEDWINDKVGSEDYYSVCEQIAHAFNDLDKARQDLMSYKLSEAVTTCETIINSLKEIENVLNNEHTIRVRFEFSINYLILMSEWIKDRCLHIQGNISEMSKVSLLDKFLDKNKEKSRLPIPLVILHRIEKIIYKFFSGEEEFLVGKLWRNSKEVSFESLLEQIKVYLECVGSDDFEPELHLEPELYRCLSELYGNTARLDFYFGKADELREDTVSIDEIDTEKISETGISISDKFLVAAYFALKLGQGYRVAHWLTHVSRLSSRLGDYEVAKRYADFAKNVINYETKDTRQVTSRIYQRGLESEVELAWGEIYLSERAYVKALKKFFISLDGSLYLSFARLAADSLYGIYRALKKLEEQGTTTSLCSLLESDNESALQEFFIDFEEDNSKKKLKLNPLDKSDRLALDKSDRLVAESGLIADLYNRLDTVDMAQSFGYLASEFKDLAKHTWRYWVESSGKTHKHPVEEAIDQGWFLEKI